MHRKAKVTNAGDIIGQDDQGRPLPPLSAAEQEDFCRAVQLALRALHAGSMTVRERNRLLWHLDRLANVTQLPLVGAYKPEETVPCIAVQVKPPYVIDWAKIKRTLTSRFEQRPEIDVVIIPQDRADRLLIHLEDAPDDAAKLDVDAPPPWAVRI